MSNIITPLIGKSKHHDPLNSKVLIDKIKDLRWDEDEILIVHDEVALFPSVPVSEALDSIPWKETSTLHSETVVTCIRDQAKKLLNSSQMDSPLSSWHYEAIVFGGGHDYFHF